MRQFPSNLYIPPRYNSDEYEELWKDFDKNGDTWTPQQIKYFFNIGRLENYIRNLTAFNFNIDYKNPTKEQYAQAEVRYVLYDLWAIIQIFKIQMPSPSGVDSYIQLAEWLAEAAEWAEDVIRPLLNKLKRCEILSSLGVELIKLERRRFKYIQKYLACNNTKAEAEAEYHDSFIDLLDSQISVLTDSFYEIVRQYIDDIKEFIQSKPKPHNLAQIKAEIIHLFPKVINLNPDASQLIKESLTTVKSNIPYQPETMLILRIKSKCGSMKNILCKWSPHRSNPCFEFDHKSSQSRFPITNRHCPFLRDILQGQINLFKRSII